MKAPRWLNRHAVCERYDTSESSLSRWNKAGVFPEPKTIGVNTIRWDENELDAYDADPEGWKARNRDQEGATA